MKRVDSVTANSKDIVTSGAVALKFTQVPKIEQIVVVQNSPVTLTLSVGMYLQIDALYYGGVAERAIFSNVFGGGVPSKLVLYSGTTPGHSMTLSGDIITFTATSADGIIFKIMRL